MLNVTITRVQRIAQSRGSLLSGPLNDSHVPPRHSQNTTNSPTHFGSAGLPVSKNKAATVPTAASKAMSRAPYLTAEKKFMSIAFQNEHSQPCRLCLT